MRQRQRKILLPWQAAGAFGAVRAAARGAVWPGCAKGCGTLDLSADCLHTLEKLMLAQATHAVAASVTALIT